ncbi:MAG: MGMT family protein, partial [Gaiellales bacterium]
MSIIIPCHRVVGSNGSLTGYGAASIASAGCSITRRRSPLGNHARGRAEAAQPWRVRRVADQPRQADPDHRHPSGDTPDQPEHVLHGRAVGLRHEAGDLARVEHVAVEGDVRTGDPVQHAVELAGRRRQPDPLDELVLGRIVVAGADERGIHDGDVPANQQQPERHP